MKKNNELDFNFDNTPYKPTVAPTRNVDRTVKKSAPASSSAPQKAQSVYRWGNTVAPPNMLTPDEIMHLNDTPAPRGGQASIKNNQTEQKPEQIPMAPVKREVPSIEAEPTASESGYSSAALEIMRRMQRAEGANISDKTLKNDPNLSTSDKSDSLQIKSNITPEKPKKIGLSFEPTQISEDHPESVIESSPITPDNNTEINKSVAAITTESDAVAAREAKAQNFQLNRDAMAEGMQELEIEMTQIFDTPTESVDGTRMFDPITDAHQENSNDCATRYINIPDAIDELYAEDEDESVIDEYNSVEDAQSITQELLIRKRRLGIRSVITSLIAVLLIIVTMFADSGTLFPFGQPPYFIAVGVLIAITVITNLSTFSSLISVFTLKPDVDFAPSFAVFAAAVQTAVSAFVGTEGMLYTSIFASAAVLSLAASTIAKRLTVSRTLANFELIANEEVKQASGFIAPPQSETITDKSIIGETLILGRRDAIDLKGFIAYSLSPDYYEKQSGRMALVTVLASFVSFAVALLTKNSISVSVSMFAATACAAAQIAVLYPNAALLSRSCRKLREKRVMLSGIKAADEISEANVIVLDSDELFFDDCVNLYKFRTFGDYAPDEAFMTAYALAMGGHSPLAGMFGKVCATQNCGMYKADSIVYENSMGITGWVNERKTLLGNRMIMESHTIPVPSMDVDRKILQSGKFPVYLAVDNKIAALFIVGYDADKGMLHRMRKLINTGVTVLVRTVDPNVTADLVCNKYGLPSDSVMTMESNASHIYSNHMKSVENAPAVLSAPNAEGFVDAYIESYAINRRNKAASIAIMVLACIMMALTVIMPIVGMVGTINILTTLISHIVTFVISMIIVAFLG